MKQNEPIVNLEWVRFPPKGVWFRAFEGEGERWGAGVAGRWEGARSRRQLRKGFGAGWPLQGGDSEYLAATEVVKHYQPRVSQAG
jgi:hypothetical protein